MAKRVGVDKWIFFTTLLLVSVGLAMVFSASAVVSEERYHSPYIDVARQAAWALAGTPQPPRWPRRAAARYEGAYQPEIRERFAALRDATTAWDEPLRKE